MLRTNWNKLWTVAEREVLSVLRTKSFWFFAIGFPILVGMPFTRVAIENSIFEDDENLDESVWQYEYFSHDDKEMIQELFWGDPLRFSISDQTGVLYKHIRFEIIAETLSPPWFDWTVADLHQWEQENSDSSHRLRDWASNTGLFEEVFWSEDLSGTLDEWLENGSIAGYFVVPKDLLTNNEPIQFVRHEPVSIRLGEKVEVLKDWFTDVVTRAMRQYRLETDQIDLDLRSSLTQGVDISIERVKPSLTVSSTDSTPIATPVQDTNLYQMVSLVFVLSFIFVLSGTSNAAVTSTIEEKSNHLSEILVSNVEAAQVLDGKLLANAIIAVFGIAMFCLIVGPLLAATSILSNYVSVFLSALLNPIKVGNWVLFLFLGIAFYGYVEIALGSLCNNVKERMMALFPIRFFHTFTLWPVLFFVVTKPSGTLAEVLSFIPIFTPYVMIARVDSLPTWPTYVVITVMMLISVFLVREFAKTLFANGMVLEQTPTSLGKIFRLSRQRS